MIRFIMSLDEAVGLVLFAFEHGENGDLLIDDLVEEMFDALEGKEHHCEFDVVETVLTLEGRYCAASVTHKATLGYIVECLHTFHDQLQTLVMPSIPDGSFEKKLYLSAKRKGLIFIEDER